MCECGVLFVCFLMESLSCRSAVFLHIRLPVNSRKVVPISPPLLLQSWFLLWGNRRRRVTPEIPLSSTPSASDFYSQFLCPKASRSSDPSHIAMLATDLILLLILSLSLILILWGLTVCGLKGLPLEYCCLSYR